MSVHINDILAGNILLKYSSGLQKSNFWAEEGIYTDYFGQQHYSSWCRKECSCWVWGKWGIFRLLERRHKLFHIWINIWKTAQNLSWGLGSVKLITVDSWMVYAGEFVNIWCPSPDLVDGSRSECNQDWCPQAFTPCRLQPSYQ